MNPRNIYQERQVGEWSRVDMLLALYNAAIDDVGRALEARRNGDELTSKREALHAERLVVELLSGLDLNHGAIAEQLQSLFLFVLKQLADGSQPQLESAIQILSSLRDGFLAIRDEAIELERSGVIPPAGAVQTIEAIA